MFRHLPLAGIHPPAHFAEAAALQGRFWPAHEWISRWKAEVAVR